MCFTCPRKVETDHQSQGNITEKIQTVEVNLNPAITECETTEATGGKASIEGSGAKSGVYPSIQELEGEIYCHTDMRWSGARHKTNQVLQVKSHYYLLFKNNKLN